MERLRGLAVRGVAPLAAVVLGVVGVVVVGVAGAALDDSIGRAGQALLLVVPVTAVAVVGGRLPAVLTAALATLAFALVVPPVGTIRVRFAEDLVALVVFSVVAFTMGALVAHRIEALVVLERQRAVLLRSVSHDLRTPLATIAAAVSELEDESLHDALTRFRLLELVGEEVERLDRLVANLLSLARVEGGGLHPRRQAVDLPELVQDCIAHLGHAAVGTDIRVDAEPGLPLVMADYALLAQVVTNLLDNAVRHSPPGQPVEVHLRARPRVVRIDVADHGPGVADGDAAAIFEAFHAGALAGTSGLGLAICKAVVEAHGGTITVRGSPGFGAVFRVTLRRR